MPTVESHTVNDLAGNSTTRSVSALIDKTAPSVTPASINDLTWRNLPLSQTFSASDDLSGLADSADASFPLTASADSTLDAGSPVATSVTRDVYDRAGNVTTRSVRALIDTVKPLVDVDGPDGSGAGWTNASPQTVSVTASDALSGLVSLACTDSVDGGTATPVALSPTFDPATSSYSVSVAGDGVHDVACTAADAAGNTENDSDAAQIDTQAPVINDAGPTASPDGTDNWYKTAVTNTFTVTDATSGLSAACTAAFPAVSGVNTRAVTTGSTEGTNVSVFSGTCADDAGNVATTVESANFKVDLQDPYNVHFIGGPAANATYFYGFVPAAPTCGATDDLSGVLGCTVTGYSDTVGAQTVTSTATDNAGRQKAASRNYTVAGWTMTGFYNPVDMTPQGASVPTYNTIKGGQTVPLKFELFAGTTELTSTASVSGITAKETTCKTTGAVDDVEATATGGTSLRYDTSAGQYVYNWQTPKTSNRCYAVTVAARDGSAKTAYFWTK
jgi:hypothetical protein